jgi:hypothetical protein
MIARGFVQRTMDHLVDVSSIVIERHRADDAIALRRSFI